MTDSESLFTEYDRTNLALVLGLVVDGKVQRHLVASKIRTLVFARRSIAEPTIREWGVGLLQYSGLGQGDAEREFETVLSSLVLAGDLAIGTAYGTRFFMSGQYQHVLLPDGRIVLLGGKADTPAAASSDQIFRFVTGDRPNDVVTLADMLGPPEFSRYFESKISLHDLPRLVDEQPQRETHPSLRAWTNFAGCRPRLFLTDRMADDTQLPRQLLQALLLCGNFRLDDLSWSMNAECAEYLNEWMGLPAAIDDSDDATDPAQETVINAEITARLLVEAGPGSGKTRTACARIASLIDRGASPSRLWVLSFTNAAVNEVRNRISAFLDDPYAVAAINLLTFDSLAGRLNSAYSTPAKKNGSYDENILRAITLFQSDHFQVADTLEKIDHLIIDETQDLAGPRRKFVELLISNLSLDTGVTVFSDFAQAIYGFQEGPSSGTAQTTSDKFGTSISDFSSHQLLTDHRTKSLRLKQLFREGRELLRDTALEPEATYDEMRKLIKSHAECLNFQDWPSEIGGHRNALLLFRSRAEVFTAADFLRTQNMPARTQLSQRSPMIAPWVGAALSGLPGDAIIRRTEFSTIWKEASLISAGLAEAEAWGYLLDMMPRRSDSITIRAISDRLSNDPPGNLLVHHLGRSGPLLSTIHAAKGREASRVLLFLPKKPASSDDWREEARILYVAATRASDRLFVTPGRWGIRQHQLTQRYRHRREEDGRGEYRIEIGQDEDLSSRHSPDLLQTAAIRDALVRLPVSGVEVCARRTGSASPYRIYLTQGAQALATLSDDFVSVVRTITGQDGETLPDEFHGFHMVGLQTVLNTSDDAPDTIGLAPVVAGLVSIKLQV